MPPRHNSIIGAAATPASLSHLREFPPEGLSQSGTFALSPHIELKSYPPLEKGYGPRGGAEASVLEAVTMKKFPLNGIAGLALAGAVHVSALGAAAQESTNRVAAEVTGASLSMAARRNAGWSRR
ncbi:MAG: hypothetical protein R3D78_06840 [Paracoccaceae bacterium]